MYFSISILQTKKKKNPEAEQPNTYVCVCLCTHTHSSNRANGQFWATYKSIDPNHMSQHPAILPPFTFSSVQFSYSVVSDSSQPHGPQHARPTCPSPTPRVYPNLRPLSRWCHPTISSSVVPFSSCLQSFPASGSFQKSQFFASSSQSIKRFSFNISPSNEHSRLISFRMDWLDLLAVQGTLKSLLQHHSSKASILQCSAFFIVPLSHPYTATGKTIALTRWSFVGKVMSLLFNMLSRLVITFLPRSKHLLISWLQSPSAVATGLENVSFHSNPKERQSQRMFKLLHNCTHLTH